MPITDSETTPLTLVADLTGAVADDGYRQVYTLSVGALPGTFVTPYRIENPFYGDWSGYPRVTVLLVPNDQDLLLAQLSSAVSSDLSGAEETNDLCAYVPGAIALTTVEFSNTSTRYLRTFTPAETSAFNRHSTSRPMFFYEIVDSDGATQFIHSVKYYHPNAAVEVDGLPVTVTRIISMAVLFHPGDPNFALERLSAGYTPTETWEPNEETGFGIPAVQLYDFNTKTVYSAGADYSATLIGVQIVRPS